jgi:hypothetical protein
MCVRMMGGGGGGVKLGKRTQNSDGRKDSMQVGGSKFVKDGGSSFPPVRQMAYHAC